MELRICLLVGKRGPQIGQGPALDVLVDKKGLGQLSPSFWEPQQRAEQDTQKE